MDALKEIISAGWLITILEFTFINNIRSNFGQYTVVARYATLRNI